MKTGKRQNEASGGQTGVLAPEVERTCCHGYAPHRERTRFSIKTSSKPEG
jgi:hypothetical protein